MIELNSLISIFFLVFTAELGDKTQLVALSLTGSSSSPWPVFFGSALALTLSTAIAVFAGNAASQTIPKIAPPLSAALFYFFGLWLLLKKETPPIKQALLNATLLEQQEARILKKLLKNENLQLDTIQKIQDHELHHASIFRRIIKKKMLFFDDINQDPRLAELTTRLTLPKKLQKKPAAIIIATLREAEQACINLYSFILSHLQQEHHKDERQTRSILKDIITEEKEHEAILSALSSPITSERRITPQRKYLRLVLSAFLLVFFAELGDKTQLTAFSAAAASPSAFSVFLGAALALITSSLLSVTLGKWLSSRLKERTLTLSSGVLFILAGSYVLYRYLQQ